MEDFRLDSRIIVPLEVDAVGQGLSGPPPSFLGRTSNAFSSAASFTLPCGIKRVFSANENNLNPNSEAEEVLVKTNCELLDDDGVNFRDEPGHQFSYKVLRIIHKLFWQKN